MKVTSVDHITINCIDLEASIAFYKSVLQLPKLDTVDMGDHVLHYFQLCGCRLELISYKNPQKIVEAGNTDVGVYRHFAVTVDDLDAMKRTCKEKGCKIRMQPSFLPQIGRTVMLIEDPNKVEIEMIQGV